MEYKKLLEEFNVDDRRVASISGSAAVAVIDEMFNKYSLNEIELIVLLKAVREFGRD